MAKNEWEIRRLNYMARHYPMVACGLVQMSINEFLQRYKRYMVNELGSCTDEDIAWAEQYIAELEAHNHAITENAQH